MKRNVPPRFCRVPQIHYPVLPVKRHFGADSDDVRRQHPIDLNSEPAVTSAVQLVGFTAQCQLRQLFLDSIRSGILCALIPLFKNSVRKSKNNFTTDNTDIGSFKKIRQGATALLQIR